MSEAANDVRDKIEFVKSYLPDDSETPMIFKFDPSMQPIMFLALRGKRSAEELRELAEKIVQPRLEQVEGVTAGEEEVVVPGEGGFNGLPGRRGDVQLPDDDAQFFEGLAIGLHIEPHALGDAGGGHEGDGLAPAVLTNEIGEMPGHMGER